jgi:hypothetical protein
VRRMWIITGAAVALLAVTSAAVAGHVYTPRRPGTARLARDGWANSEATDP